jgi:ABC-type Mn2+/Zn2+ transport system ATPase subunit
MSVPPAPATPADPRFPYRHRRHRPGIAGAPALEIADLVAGYGDAAETALDRVSLLVPMGARFALVGPNGAGKSTLLKAISGLLAARGGTISIHGLPVGACHHRVAYLPQRSDIDWNFPVSVSRLVLAGRYVHLGWLRRPGERDHAIAREMMALLGLADLGQRQIGRLSGGQQQRALLARALAQEADLLLLDEPFNAVDVETRAVVTTLLDDLRKRGKTVLIATHDIAGREDDYDGALYLCDGKMAAPPPAGTLAVGHFH